METGIMKRRGGKGEDLGEMIEAQRPTVRPHTNNRNELAKLSVQRTNQSGLLRRKRALPNGPSNQAGYDGKVPCPMD